MQCYDISNENGLAVYATEKELDIVRLRWQRNAEDGVIFGARRESRLEPVESIRDLVQVVSEYSHLSSIDQNFILPEQYVF